MEATALTTQEADEFTAALTRMGLVQDGFTPRYTPLAGGVSSLIVRADLEGQSVCIKRALARLKVAKEWLAPVERSDAEANWLETASSIAPDFVPRVLGRDSVSRAFAMEFLEPADYPVWKTQLLAGQADTRTALAVAASLAALHNATAGRARMAARFPNQDTFYSIRLEPYFVATGNAHPQLASLFGALVERTANTRIALIHGDVSPKNILVGARHPVLVDAECATYGDPAFDAAFCLNHLLLKCIWRPASTKEYLACFDTFAQAYLDAAAWEPRAQLEHRVATLLPAMLLARIDGKSPVEYITQDKDRDLVRRFAIHALQHPASAHSTHSSTHALAALRTTWNEHIQ